MSKLKKKKKKGTGRMLIAMKQILIFACQQQWVWNRGGEDLEEFINKILSPFGFII